jgi:hypothetical protein
MKFKNFFIVIFNFILLSNSTMNCYNKENNWTLFISINLFNFHNDKRTKKENLKIIYRIYEIKKYNSFENIKIIILKDCFYQGNIKNPLLKYLDYFFPNLKSIDIFTEELSINLIKLLSIGTFPKNFRELTLNIGNLRNTNIKSLVLYCDKFSIERHLERYISTIKENNIEIKQTTEPLKKLQFVLNSTDLIFNIINHQKKINKSLINNK